MPPHWAGLGASVDINALLEQQLGPSALNSVTPQIRDALAAGYNTVNSLAPAYSLASKIDSGGVPNEQETIDAMAGLATAINPLAGAAVLAAGNLVSVVEQGAEDLLKGLGLISDAPKPVPYVGLIKKGQPVPASPTDPLWMPWGRFARWWYPPSGATDYAWYPGILGGTPALTQGPGSSVIQNLMGALKYTSPNHDARPGNSAATALVMTPQPANAFEAFLLPIMMKNIEYWANANPYVDPRLLLGAAVAAWNQLHPSSSADVTYHPAEYGQAASDQNAFWIDMLLGGSGDSSGNNQRVNPLTVQMGPAAPSGPRAVSLHIKSGSLTTATTGGGGISTETIAAGSAVAVGGLALGTVIYSYAAGKTIDAVLGSAWRGLKGLFR